jgi:hypothetical protein
MDQFVSQSVTIGRDHRSFTDGHDHPLVTVTIGPFYSWSAVTIGRDHRGV